MRKYNRLLGLQLAVAFACLLFGSTQALAQPRRRAHDDVNLTAANTLTWIGRRLQ